MLTSKYCIGTTPLPHFKDALGKQYYHPSRTWLSCDCIPSSHSQSYFCGTPQSRLTASPPPGEELLSPLAPSVTLVARYSIRLNRKQTHFSVPSNMQIIKCSWTTGVLIYSNMVSVSHSPVKYELIWFCHQLWWIYKTSVLKLRWFLEEHR